MKYFAEVVEGIVINLCQSEEESLGSPWVEFSHDGSFRYNSAMIGGTYDKDKDAFLSPKPLPSWTLNAETLRWEPPVPKPQGPAAWDEINQVWNTPDEV